MIKKIAFALVLISLAVGVFFYIQYERKVYNAVADTQGATLDLVNFVKTEFPDKVADYVAKQQAKSALPAITPAPAPAK